MKKNSIEAQTNTTRQNVSSAQGAYPTLKRQEEAQITSELAESEMEQARKVADTLVRRVSI